MAKWLSLLTSNQRIPGSNPGVCFIFFCIQHKHIFFFKTPFETIVPFNCRVTTKIITGSHPSKRFHGYLLFGFFQLKPTPNFLVLLFFLDLSTNSVVKIEASTDDDVRVTKKCMSDHTSFSTLVETSHYCLGHN